MFFVAAGAVPRAAAAAGGSEPLAIHVRTRMAREPADVLVRARVEPDPRSRELTIEWWSADGIGGSHLISLAGDRSATWHDYFIKRMEAGRYEVAAVLKRNDGTEVRRTITVIVLDRIGSRSSAFSLGLS